MANLLKVLAGILIICSFNIFKIGASPCVFNPTTCECKHEDEVILNLNHLVAEPLTLQHENSKYQFSGCKDSIKCNGKDVSLCLTEYTKDKNGTNTTKTDTILGYTKDINIADSLTHLSAYDIVFNYMDLKTAISLVCSNSLPKPVLAFIPPSNQLQHELALFSPHACKVIPHPGLSTGSKLLLIFFMAMLIYFSLGALVLYFVRGARGLEIIPNIDFWRGLPSLVRDGTLYLMNGCNPVVVPTAEAYDSI